MTAHSDGDAAKLRSEMDRLHADIAKIGETLKMIMNDGKEVARSHARHAAADVQEHVTSTIEAAAHEIEERPLTAALSAFGVGLILGMLFSRHD